MSLKLITTALSPDKAVIDLSVQVLKNRGVEYILGQSPPITEILEFADKLKIKDLLLTGLLSGQINPSAYLALSYGDFHWTYNWNFYRNLEEARSLIRIQSILKSLIEASSSSEAEVILFSRIYNEDQARLVQIITTNEAAKNKDILLAKISELFICVVKSYPELNMNPLQMKLREDSRDDSADESYANSCFISFWEMTSEDYKNWKTDFKKFYDFIDSFPQTMLLQDELLISQMRYVEDLEYIKRKYKKYNEIIDAWSKYGRHWEDDCQENIGAFIELITCRIDLLNNNKDLLKRVEQI